MKTKPFNLEEALNGAKVVTRDGREVLQLTKFECLNLYSLVGVVDGAIQKWTSEGIFDNQISESHLDLFLAVEPQRIYKNVYRSSIDGGIELGASHKTKEQAVKQGSDAENYIKTIEITDEP